MKKIILVLVTLAFLFFTVACQPQVQSGVDSVQATATAQAVFLRLPPDVPIMDGAYDLMVSSTGNNIIYRLQAVFEEVIQFYQQETLAMGWEQLGGEQIMMESITMQRMKPEKNMSILISTIQGGSEILVNIMIASR